MIPTNPQKEVEVARGFRLITEHRGRKQLSGLRLIPFLERYGIEPYIVHNFHEPPRDERPAPEVVHDLSFFLTDNLVLHLVRPKIRFSERSADINSGESHFSANEASRSINCVWSSRYFPKRGQEAKPTLSMMARSRERVVMKKSVCSE